MTLLEEIARLSPQGYKSLKETIWGRVRQVLDPMMHPYGPY